MKKQLAFLGKEYVLLFLFAIIQVLTLKEYSIYIAITALIVLVPLFAYRLMLHLKKERKKDSITFLDLFINLAMLLVFIALGYIIITL